MVYFPQINANLIMTQLPYKEGSAFDSVIQDVEVGIRYSFPRRGAGLDGFPAGPLGSFAVNFSQISDAEVLVLQDFFFARRGRWQSFRFLDPGGNLLLYSEDFTKSYWDKSSGVTIGGLATDPFGGNLARAASGGAHIQGLVGPSDGGMSGFRVTVSAWVKGLSAGLSGRIGFTDGTTTNSATWAYTNGAWVRIYYSTTIWTNSPIYALVDVPGSIDIFGAQVVPMKGEGAYVRSPDNYGYHENCRFDSDSFDVRIEGPGQNAVNLPIVEFNV